MRRWVRELQLQREGSGGNRQAQHLAPLDVKSAFGCMKSVVLWFEVVSGEVQIGH